MATSLVKSKSTGRPRRGAASSVPLAARHAKANAAGRSACVAHSRCRAERDLMRCGTRAGSRRFSAQTARSARMTVPWWRRGILYHIYPRSFMDTNGDGIGDLRGIAARLDYLCELGIDAVWLSPIYPSPMADFGYDVEDYTNVDPVFG